MRSFLLDTFSEVVINTQDDTTYDVDLSKRIVSFFVDHYDQVWVPPTDLRKEVEERVSKPQTSKYQDNCEFYQRNTRFSPGALLNRSTS